MFDAKSSETYQLVLLAQTAPIITLHSPANVHKGKGYAKLLSHDFIAKRGTNTINGSFFLSFFFFFELEDNKSYG